MGRFDEEFEKIRTMDLAEIALEMQTFKEQLMRKYLNALAKPFGVDIPVPVEQNESAAEANLQLVNKADKLNIGCGLDYREGFVNIDGNPDLPRVDFVLEIKPGVLLDNFKQESVSYILVKDFLEHHFHWEAHGLLKDFFALLKDGGELDIIIPRTRKNHK